MPGENLKENTSQPPLTDVSDVSVKESPLQETVIHVFVAWSQH